MVNHWDNLWGESLGYLGQFGLSSQLRTLISKAHLVGGYMVIIWAYNGIIIFIMG